VSLVVRWILTERKQSGPVVKERGGRRLKICEFCNTNCVGGWGPMVWRLIILKIFYMMICNLEVEISSIWFDFKVILYVEMQILWNNIHQIHIRIWCAADLWFQVSVHLRSYQVIFTKFCPLRYTKFKKHKNLGSLSHQDMTHIFGEAKKVNFMFLL
jgi:hypothetical protein